MKNKAIDFKSVADALIDHSCTINGVDTTIRLLNNLCGLNKKQLLELNFYTKDIDQTLEHKIELGYNMLNYIEQVASMEKDELYNTVLPHLGFYKEDIDKIADGTFDNDDAILDSFELMATQISMMVSDEVEERRVMMNLGFNSKDIADFL